MMLQQQGAMREVLVWELEVEGGRGRIGPVDRDFRT